jgi:hypothetical protein
VLGDDLKVIDGAAAGAWIEPRLGGEFGAVTLQVPKGYEAYARVLHPASDRDGNPVRWAEVAEACGTSAHREMQWDALTGSPDPCAAWGSRWSGNRPLTGAMDTDELDALCEILSAHTADSGQCCFGLCTIEGWLDSFSADELEPLLRLPMDRDYIVLSGLLLAVDQILRDWSKPNSSRIVLSARRGDGPLPNPSRVDSNVREPPHLIWPADHSWLVASEVDFDSTLVGGSSALIEAIVESPELEAWQVEPTTSLACDADKINGTSDRDG